MLILLLALSAAIASADNKSLNLLININQIPRLISQTELTREDIPSPHWNNNSCEVCHYQSENIKKNSLRKKDIGGICLSCHNARYDHRYIHPVDVKPSGQMLARMNGSYKESLKKSMGKVSCTTCHDILLQCKNNENRNKFTNPKFFRLGPFKSRSQPCYFCHDRTQYKRLNPHDQIDSNGKIKKNKCKICHAGSVDDLINADNIDQVKFHAADDNLVSMCWGCHVWTPHPGGQFSFFKNKAGPNHLIVPPIAILKSLKTKERSSQTLMPLEPATGKIFCATCHNPHQKGVVKNKLADKGANRKHRLRVSNICNTCHNK